MNLNWQRSVLTESLKTPMSMHSGLKDLDDFVITYNAITDTCNTHIYIWFNAGALATHLRLLRIKLSTCCALYSTQYTTNKK